MKRLLMFLASVLVVGTLLPSQALAFDLFPVCDNGGGGGSAICQNSNPGNTNPLTGPNGLFRGIAGVIATVAGLIAVIMIIIGGLRFVLAGGDPAKVKTARESIIYAIIGLVVIVLADSIISLVLNRI